MGAVDEGYRFSSFEVRLREGILLRKGHRQKIQDLPFQMLLVLIQRPGVVVTKEELGIRLWGQRSFIDVDKSLYVVAAKLREVLGDDASRPRLIKTVSGVGYRFVGNVEPFPEPASQAIPDPIPNPIPEPVPHITPAPAPLAIPESPPDFDSPASVVLVSDSVVPAILAPRLVRIWNVRRTVLWAPGLIAAAVAAAFGLYFYLPHRPLIHEQDKIAVGGFVNSTGDADLDKIVGSSIALKLEESPYLSILPARRFRALIQDPDTASIKDQLRACVALHGQALLSGRILTGGSGYKVQLMAWRCSDGHLLDTEKSYADAKAAILPALDSVVLQMRRELGESDESLKKFNSPLMRATSNSLSALRAYTMGEEKRITGHEIESIVDYKLATDLDPQFALAYARLGTVYYNHGEFELSNQNSKKAFDLRDRATDQERLYITAHYFANATGESERAAETYQLWRAMYPHDTTPVNNLAVQAMLEGHPDDALTLAKAAVQLDPVASQPYSTLVQAYMMVGDYKDLNAACDNLADGKKDSIVIRDACFQGGFAQNDEAMMQRQLQWAHQDPIEKTLFNDMAAVELYRGRADEAQKNFQAAAESARKYGLDGSAAGTYMAKAEFEARLGFERQAKDDAASALKSAPNSRIMLAEAAMILAEAGDIADAETDAEKARAEAPLDTLLNSALLASTKAAICLRQHRPAEAIQALEVARPYDDTYFLPFIPTYLRGLAYLDNQQPEKAAEEFRQVLNHRAIAPVSLYVPLSELQLGRASQLAGDYTSAERAYQQATKDWKTADADFPPLRELHNYQHELDISMAHRAAGSGR